MEKLIELLNEFSSEDFNWCEIDGKIFDKSYEFGDAPVNFEMGVYIISKQFGFIKWLVENDKIDFSREGDLSNELVNLFGRKLDNAEGVIALLSVQDEPIRFLCEILK